MIRRKVKFASILIASLIMFSACAKNDEAIIPAVNKVQGTVDTQMLDKGANIKSENTKPSSRSASQEDSVSPKSSTGKEPNTEDLSSVKNKISILHDTILRDLTSGSDAKIISQFFSNNYINIFTGNKTSVDEGYLNEFYKSDDVIRYKAPSELIDYTKRQVLTYKEIMESPEKYFVNNTANFKYEEDDILAIYPPSKGSTLKYGWIGVYRKKNKGWNIVAGSFPLTTSSNSSVNATTSSAIRLQEPPRRTTSAAVHTTSGTIRVQQQPRKSTTSGAIRSSTSSAVGIN